VDAFGFEPLQMRQGDTGRRRGNAHAAQTYAVLGAAVKLPIRYDKVDIRYAISWLRIKSPWSNMHPGGCIYEHID
jgi:hypothetical protein